MVKKHTHKNVSIRTLSSEKGVSLGKQFRAFSPDTLPASHMKRKQHSYIDCSVHSFLLIWMCSFPTSPNTHTHTHTHTHTRARAHAHTHARTHRHTHTCTHTQTLTFTHTHTHTDPEEAPMLMCGWSQPRKNPVATSNEDTVVNATISFRHFRGDNLKRDVTMPPVSIPPAADNILSTPVTETHVG